MEPQTACENTTSESIQNTFLDPNEQQGRETPTKQKPMNSEQSTDHGAGKSSQYFSLLDLCGLTFSLDGIEVLNAQDATNEQFAALADAVADVTNVEQWYLEERRDFINGLQSFCEERNYPFPFTLVDEVQEQGTPTATLTLENEETGFLYDVERAKPVMQANPEMNAKELAESLALKSTLYAQTVKVYVNAHKSAKEGA